MEYDSKTKRVFGDFEIDCVSRDDLVDWCMRDIEKNQKTKVVMDANGHALSLARTDAKFRGLIQKSDIIHADGGFLVTLSKVMRGPKIPERSATTDLIHDFAKKFEGKDHSFFLLGGTEEVNSLCNEKLSQIYPELKIAGRRNGYFSKSEEPELINQIKQSGANVVWVGLGKPKEQEFAMKLKCSLNSTWIITCGGCFNYITGHYKRAPRWMQKMNIEWLHRLVKNPKQLFFRYAVTSPHAIWIALRS